MHSSRQRGVKAAIHPRQASPTMRTPLTPVTLRGVHVTLEPLSPQDLPASLPGGVRLSARAGGPALASRGGVPAAGACTAGEPAG